MEFAAGLKGEIMETVKLCRHCIDAIKSRGETVFVGDIVPDEIETDELKICEWCEEEYIELFECMF